MKDKKRKWLLIVFVVLFVPCIVRPVEAMNKIMPVKGVAAISRYEKGATVFCVKDDSFFEARNIKCNMQEEEELLSKSKRERVLVTEKN